MKVKTIYDDQPISISAAVERLLSRGEDTNERVNDAIKFIGDLVEELHRKEALGKKGVLRLLPGYEEHE